MIEAGPPRFAHLFSPLRIGSMILRNRIVMAPHAVTFTAGYGDLKERVIDYHIERARGGAGLVTMSNFVRPASWERLASWNGVLATTPLGGLDIANDRTLLPHYRRLIAGVHAEGACFISQLNASGRQFHSAGTMQFGLPLLAPSELPCPRMRESPKAITVVEIVEYIQAFADAAECLAEAGADGVEIFAAQGYLLHEFLSPLTNRRDDDYGGNLDNRMRFLEQSIAEIRRRTRRDFVVGVRINGDDGLPGGIDIVVAEATAQRLHAIGQIDYLNISGLTSAAYPAWIAPETTEPAPFAKDAARIRKATPGLPICVVSRIATPQEADRLLATGVADLVGLVRPLISDAEWPNKAKHGCLDEIRVCTYCNACIVSLDSGRGIRCIHNMAVGREAQLGIGRVGKAPVSKRVFVIGGGPAGLAAARVAAERGHVVTLCEAGPELGGQLRDIERVPTRHMYREIRRWLEHRLDTLGVDIRLGTQISPAQINAANPDAVIIAIGSEAISNGASAFRPEQVGLSGSELSHVTTVPFSQDLGTKVAIIDEDPCHRGTGAALFLAAKGHSVTLITPSVHVGAPLHIHHIPALMREMAYLGVVTRTNTLVTAITQACVFAEDRYRREAFALGEFDSVVLATGHRARRLAGAKQISAPVVFAGDCIAPRGVEAAIQDGERAAWSI